MPVPGRLEHDDFGADPLVAGSNDFFVRQQERASGPARPSLHSGKPTRSRSRATLGVLAGTLVAAACTSYSPAPLDLAAMTAMATTRRLDSDDVRRVVVAFTGQEPTVWPPQHLDLAQAFAIALHCRPEFRSARAALASRRAAH